MNKQIKPLSPEAEEYIGIAKVLLNKAIQAYTLTQKPSSNYIIDNIVLIRCICNHNTAIAYIIYSATSGIILHPRSGVIKDQVYYQQVTDDFGTTYTQTNKTKGVDGGWKNGTELLVTEYIYPLVDEDNASFVLTSLEEGTFVGPEGSYGNLYWDNNNPDDYKVLSWRGTPTRHFRLPTTINLPGFTLQETIRLSQGDIIPEYTSFGINVYKGGIIYREAPSWNWSMLGNPKTWILGACINKEDGKVYIVTQSDHYNAPENVWITAEGRTEGTEKPAEEILFERQLTKPGFFVCMWREDGLVDGWELIAEHSYTRNGLPWFANTDGTTFVCSNGDTLDTLGNITYQVKDSGEFYDSGRLCENKFTADYQDEMYFEYKDNIKIAGMVTTKNTMTSETVAKVSKPTTIHGPFTILIKDEIKPLTLLSSTGGDAPLCVSANYQFTSTGGKPPITWSGDVDSTGKVIPAACGSGTVTITDACGTTISRSLHFTSGATYRTSASRSAQDGTLYCTSYGTGPNHQAGYSCAAGGNLNTKQDEYISYQQITLPIYEDYRCTDIYNICGRYDTRTNGYPNPIYDRPLLLGNTNPISLIAPNSDTCPGARRCGSLTNQTITLPIYHNVCRTATYIWSCGLVAVGDTSDPLPGETKYYSYVKL